MLWDAVRLATRWYPFERGRTRLTRAFLASRSVPEHVTARLPNGRTLEMPGRDLQAAQFHLFGSFEPGELQAFTSRLPRGGVVLDVGANLGLYAVSAADAVGPDGRVIAFEPARATRERLERNLAANGLAERVTVEPLGVGAKPGELQLVSFADSGRARFDVGGAPDDATGTETVGVTTLDGYAKAHALDRVDAIKMDVEGAEVDALRGAKDVLARHRPVVLVECADAHLRKFGTDARALVALLVSAGYDVQKARGRKLEPVTEADPLAFENLLALPPKA